MSKATDKAYRIIRARLLDGAFAPGDRLNEAELSELCGVSRTPVREAIRKLALDYFVRLEPNRGAFVIDWGRNDIADMFEMRALMEGLTARRAAERANISQIDEMDRLVSEIDTAIARLSDSTVDDFLRLNRRFHELFLEASGSQRLAEVMSRFVERAVVARTASQYTLEDMRRSNEYHRDLAQAVRARNASLAEQLMRVHILSASTFYQDVYMQDAKISATAAE